MKCGSRAIIFLWLKLSKNGKIAGFQLNKMFFQHLQVKMSENKEETVGIMKLIPGKLAPLVIVVGDPGRAEQFSSHLEVLFFFCYQMYKSPICF